MSDKQALDNEIRFVGGVGLLVVALSLWSATVRLPGTAAGIATLITPLLRVEFPQSKADLEDIFGAPDSENRKIIAERPLPLIGQDFVPGWMLFLFFLYKLLGRVMPHMEYVRKYILLLLIGTMLVDYAALNRMAAAAQERVYTDAMALTISRLSLVKWLGLFVNTVLCATVLAHSHLALQFGYYILLGASIAGSYAVTSETWLIAPCVFGLFVGLCGISALFLIRPELLYAKQRSSPGA